MNSESGGRLSMDELKDRNRMLEASQPKPAGKESAMRSSNSWRKVRDWLWDHLPRPTLEWLIVIPLGGAAWLLWRLANHFADLVEQVMP